MVKLGLHPGRLAPDSCPGVWWTNQKPRTIVQAIGSGLEGKKDDRIPCEIQENTRSYIVPKVFI